VVISDTDAVYLYGLDILAQQQSERLYYMHDGLGSVRQLVDTTGQVETNYAYDPFGVPVLAGDGSNPYQFTGEAWDAELELLYLRARYYQPEVGRFVSRDPWEGDSRQPQTLLGTYAYVGNNPASYVDPTGKWLWYPPPEPYHFLIEAYYEGSLFFINPIRHLEYPIPGTPRRHPDMFDSVTGAVYEIEPCYSRSEGLGQVKDYVADLLRAKAMGALKGRHLLGRYDWNSTPFHVGTWVEWPGKYRMPMPHFPGVDLVADYWRDGVVIYWLEPNALVQYGAQPFVVPNKKLVKPYNWAPNLLPAPQPAYAVSLQQACGYGLMALGGGIIVLTFVTDLSIIGTLDDAVTVPAGVFFISYGQRLAVQVPAFEHTGETWWQE
jgi:RHS repeat-associated protein